MMAKAEEEEAEDEAEEEEEQEEEEEVRQAIVIREGDNAQNETDNEPDYVNGENHRGPSVTAVITIAGWCYPGHRTYIYGCNGNHC